MTSASLISDVKTGDLFLRNFDEGMVRTLGGEEVDESWYLPLDYVPGVLPPLFSDMDKRIGEIGRPMPGIPIIFKNPGDAVQRYSIPCIRVSREDPSPALERWCGLEEKYKRPAPGAKEVTVEEGGRTLEGYDKYESQLAPWPYDIPYTLAFEANGLQARTNAQTMLRHGMGIFGPHGVVCVYDSLGGKRFFEVFGEGPSDLSMVSDIRDRVIIYAISLRVAGQFDLSAPYVSKAVTEFPTQNFHKKT